MAGAPGDAVKSAAAARDGQHHLLLRLSERVVMGGKLSLSQVEVACAEMHEAEPDANASELLARLKSPIPAIRAAARKAADEKARERRARTMSRTIGVLRHIESSARTRANLPVGESDSSRV